MGCLNSTGQFTHWFANIHLSGPCNRSCYFCIGQHMLALDSENVLDTWPLPNLDRFVEECLPRTSEINVTGTNTDPLLFKHLQPLKTYLINRIPNLVFKARTNGIKISDDLALFDGGSVTCCSTNPEIYRTMMGQGSPPNWEKLRPYLECWKNPKINIVLGPENRDGDWLRTVRTIRENTSKWANGGFRRFNLREPYGQPHIGDPLDSLFKVMSRTLGMSTYSVEDALVTYWDVHYCEVESVNLYASGRISIDYPITRGHSPRGVVRDQSNFVHGRQFPQWVRIRGVHGRSI